MDVKKRKQLYLSLDYVSYEGGEDMSPAWLADEDTGYGNKAESDSIGNQRTLINRFLDNHPVLSKCPRLEFADDGGSCKIYCVNSQSMVQ